MTKGFNYPEDTYLLVGKITKAHGLRGEVKVHSYSDDTESLLRYTRIVLIGENGELSPELKIVKSRLQGKAVVFKLDSVDDRDGAERIHGKGLLIYKEDLQQVEDGEYYWYQFYNLPVYTEDGHYLGKVASLFSNGAQDILVIRANGEELLIPILDEIIKEHTPEKVVVTPPPGLLGMNTQKQG